MAKPPVSIGRYEVVRPIGHGGMGSLYLVWDPKLERQIAIKLLKEDDDDLRERFAREARSAARLRHPHIVTIYDVGDHDGQPFIAMEFVQGETLSEIISSRRPLTLTRKVELVEAICDGLGFAHKAGIVHRDIKPANIMVDNEGALKILDFGIARAMESAGMTQAGMLIGTLNYMSPEQVGGSNVDHRSDIFAVGAVFYELVSYRQAFPGSVLGGVLNKILHEQPEPLTELVRGVHPEVVRVITRAVEKKPEDRYQDLAAMRKELLVLRLHLEQNESMTEIIESPAAGRAEPRHTPKPTPTPGRRGVEREELARRRAGQIQSHLERARQAIASGDFEASVAACEQALLLDPDNAESVDLLDQARTGLEQRQAKAWLSSAQEDLARGALTSARGLVERAAALDPSAAVESGLESEVEKAFDERHRAREREAAVATALEQAQARFDAGAFDEALTVVLQALELDAEHVDAAALRGRIERAQARAERITTGIERARDEARREEFTAALSRLRGVRQADGPAPEIDAVIREIDGQREDAERVRREREEARRREDAERIRREREEAKRREDAERARREREEARRREDSERARREREDARRREADAAREAAATVLRPREVAGPAAPSPDSPTMLSPRAVPAPTVAVPRDTPAQSAARAPAVSPAPADVTVGLDRDLQWTPPPAARPAERATPAAIAAPATTPPRALYLGAAAAAAVIALGAIGYFAFGSGDDTEPPPAATQTQTQGPAPEQPSTPAAVPPPAPPPVAPVATAQTPARPPAPGPAAPARGDDLAVIRRLAKDQFDRGDHAAALVTAMDGWRQNSNDNGLKMLFRDMTDAARTAARTARASADAVGTQATSSPRYGDARTEVDRAEAGIGSGVPPDGPIKRLRNAADLFSRAAEDGRKAAATPAPAPTPPPVAPPVSTNPPPASTTTNPVVPPPPPPPGPPTPEQEKDAVRLVVREYARWFQAKNADQVARIYRTDLAALRKNYDNVNTQALHLPSSFDVVLDGAKATAQVNARLEVDVKVGGRQSLSVSRLDLQKLDGRWIIVNIGIGR